MKIVYLTSMRLPSAMAHAIQVMKVCESLGRVGHDVILFCTAERRISKEYPSEYFGTKEDSFRLVTIPAFSSIVWLPLRYKVHLVYHAIAALVFSVFSRADVYYTRDILPALVTTLLPGRTLLEVHDMPSSWVRLNTFVYKRVNLIVSTTEWTKQNLCKQLGLDPQKIIVECNGVDSDIFASAVCDESVRKECSPKNLYDKIVMYTGHLYDWKGAHVLAEAAKTLPPAIRVAFVGGSDADTKKFKAKYGAQENISILGHRAYRDISRYLSCADVFVLPNITEGVSNANHSKNATSPVKLFEYLSYGKPIIASDLPSIRGLVPARFCVFVPQNNPTMLAEAIVQALGRVVDIETAAAMKQYAQEHTWMKRSERVLCYLQKICPKQSNNL